MCNVCLCHSVHVLCFSPWFNSVYFSYVLHSVSGFVLVKYGWAAVRLGGRLLDNVCGVGSLFGQDILVALVRDGIDVLITSIITNPEGTMMTSSPVGST